MAFIDQVEFEAMKTLSGRRASRCSKYQFYAKMTVNTYLNLLRDIDQGLNKVVITSIYCASDHPYIESLYRLSDASTI